MYVPKAQGLYMLLSWLAGNECHRRHRIVQGGVAVVTVLWLLLVPFLLAALSTRACAPMGVGGLIPISSPLPASKRAIHYPPRLLAADPVALVCSAATAAKAATAVLLPMLLLALLLCTLPLLLPPMISFPVALLA